MITIQSVCSTGLDLLEVENLRKWIEYNPDCYKEKVESGELYEQDLESNLVLLRIKKLYKLINKIDGKLDKKQRNFNLNTPHSFEDDEKYQRLVNSIPALDIYYYADLKLTDEEKEYAYNFMKQCNQDNSKEMMEYAENYSNFFIGTYMIELLRNHPESNYIYSAKNISIQVESANKRLAKKVDTIKKT